jgi:hypothetical protein
VHEEHEVYPESFSGNTKSMKTACHAKFTTLHVAAKAPRKTDNYPSALNLSSGFGLKEEATVGNDAPLNVLFAAKCENARRVE